MLTKKWTIMAVTKVAIRVPIKAKGKKGGYFGAKCGDFSGKKSIFGLKFDFTFLQKWAPKFPLKIEAIFLKKCRFLIE